VCELSANLPKGSYFKNYLRLRVCFKSNDGGGRFLGGKRHCHWRQGSTRHCQWRQSRREGCIAPGSGDIGHVGVRIAILTGDTQSVGLAITMGGIGLHGVPPALLARQPWFT